MGDWLGDWSGGWIGRWLSDGWGDWATRLPGSHALLDLAIAAVALEIAALWWWHRRTGRGLAPRRVLPNLLAGLCLMLALRAVLGGAPVWWMAAALAGSGLAHVADLRGRWPGRAEG